MAAGGADSTDGPSRDAMQCLVNLSMKFVQLPTIRMLFAFIFLVWVKHIDARTGQCFHR